MSAVTITLVSTCSGGNHLTFTASGAKAATIKVLRDELLDAVSNEEALAFIKVVVKLAKSGRTLAQAKALLEAGVTITI